MTLDELQAAINSSSVLASVALSKLTGTITTIQQMKLQVNGVRGDLEIPAIGLYNARAEALRRKIEECIVDLQQMDEGIQIYSRRWHE